MRRTAALCIRKKTDADFALESASVFSCGEKGKVSSPQGACGGGGDMIEWNYICRTQEEDR